MRATGRSQGGAGAAGPSRSTAAASASAAHAHNPGRERRPRGGRPGAAAGRGGPGELHGGACGSGPRPGEGAASVHHPHVGGVARLRVHGVGVRRRGADPGAGRRPGGVVARAREASGEGERAWMDSDGRVDPRLEVQVPKDQRPVNELANLKGAFLYSWGALDGRAFATRVGALFAGVFVVLGGPIASGTYPPQQAPLPFFVCGSLGSLLTVAVVVLRLYLGWSYVGTRLLSASVEYEETGWYDGQVWVKPPEVLARDRLLGSYEVKPVLRRLKGVLLGTGGALAGLIVLLNATTGEAVQAAGQAARQVPQPRVATATGAIFSPQVSELYELMEDDAAAAAETAELEQYGVPAYCGDRYFRARAGASADVCN